MTKKKNGSKKIFDSMHVEPEHANDENAEAARKNDVPEPELNDNARVDEPVISDTVNNQEDQSEPAKDDSSPDDILNDVRRSLIEEEEAHEQEDQPKWWKRIGRGSKKKQAEAPKPPVVEEINLPNLDTVEPSDARLEEPEEFVDDMDDLIELLEKEDASEKKTAVVDETPPEPEKVKDIEELKRQAFQSRPEAAGDENLTEVRSIALQGDEEVFVEVESTPQDPVEERLTAMENALKPYRRYINFGLAFLGLIMAVIAAMVLFNIYQRSAAAAATPEVVSDLPFPASVSLPGGWTFELGKGSLVDGQWNPRGAEWLQGTEVCRWVALPWSRQLEAVVRTLKQDDPINLGMSNNDILTYQVYSVEQMSPEQMQRLDSNSPCLLIVLAEPEAEERWVLTARP